MSYTRRKFLEATGALAAAAGLGRSVNPLAQSVRVRRRAHRFPASHRVTSACYTCSSADARRAIARTDATRAALGDGMRSWVAIS